jgi:hypothetical protein
LQEGFYCETAFMIAAEQRPRSVIWRSKRWIRFGISLGL